MSNLRYFKDSVIDDSWKTQGILYMVLDGETKKVFCYLRNGSRRETNVKQERLEEMVREDRNLIVEIPAAEAFLL